MDIIGINKGILIKFKKGKFWYEHVSRMRKLDNPRRYWMPP